jgi:ceramide glucosyltransferase
MAPITVALLMLVAGACVYCVLGVLAVRSYLRQPRLRKGSIPASILKPLMGAEEGLEENLRSFFEQRHEEFEILAAVRTPDDPAAAVFEKLRSGYPHVPSRLIVTGEPPYPNAKVFSLEQMMRAARYELLVMSDSDVRATPEMLSVVAAEFEDTAVGLSTCLYRAVPGRSFWSIIEAMGMNTEFAAGVLTARMLEGMKFALGPTICARKTVIENMGGFERLKNYLAEDFVMGQLAAGMGWRVLLSRYVIEHRIGSQPFGANLRHRVRWCRSTRRSRPWGYAGQVFTNPLPLALLLWSLEPAWWPIVLLTAWLRAWLAYAVAWQVLRDFVTRRLWWLLPLEDVISFLIWTAGFFGNTVLWRGRRYFVNRDGTFRLAR